MFAIAIVLIVATIPPVCASTCCPLSAMSVRMMASMPCCGGSAKIHSDVRTSDTPDATLVASTNISPRTDAAVLASVAIDPSTVTSSLRVVHAPLDDSAGDTPPIFLRDAQFRI